MDEIEQEAERTFHPHRRSTWTAVVLNVVLAVVLLGVPYARGRIRAQASAEGFSAVAACLYGGDAVPGGGLALPTGDREHFAEQVARAAADWPARCAPALQALRPAPSLVLFPSPKQAEEDLRRAVDLAEAELGDLSRLRNAANGRQGLGQVPDRPLRAVAQLRASLATVLEASDLAVNPGAQAVLLPASALVASPSRVPMNIDRGGAFAARLEHGALRIAGLDARHVEEVLERAGHVDTLRVARPPSVRGLTSGPAGTWLVWATRESACADDGHRCAKRRSALGMLAEGTSEPLPQFRVEGHPSMRLDRSIRVTRDEAWLLARAGEQGNETEFRRFSLIAEAPAPEDTPADDALPLRPPMAFLPLGRPADAVLGESGPEWVVEDADGEATLRRDRGAPIPLGSMRVQRGQTVIVPCGGWSVVATLDGVAIVMPDSPVVAHVVVPLRPPVLGADAGDDAIACTPTSDGVDVVALGRDHALVRWACSAAGCGESQTVATAVHHFAVAHASGTTLVAWSGDRAHPQVRVARLRGPLVGPVEIPSPCWDTGEGLCGSPLVLAGDGRLLVGARAGAELLLVELTPTGFSRLPGL